MDVTSQSALGSNAYPELTAAFEVIISTVRKEKILKKWTMSYSIAAVNIVTWMTIHAINSAVTCI